MAKVLSNKEKIASISKSLGVKRWFRTDDLFSTEKLNVDLKAGIIKDMVLCQEGEAKGHGIFLEKSFIQDLINLGNVPAIGIKNRFGHPSMSTESLGTFMGYFKNFRVREAGGISQAIADLHLSEVAKAAPAKGDLYQWALSVAQDASQSCGLSIVFTQGWPYQRDDNGIYYPSFKRYDEEGDAYTIEPTFEKGDEGEIRPFNPDLPLFATIEELHGTDFVDEPAATTDGLFSSVLNADKPAVIASQFFDEHPEIFDLLLKNPDILDGFVKRYEAYRTKQKSASMKKETVKLSDKAKASLKKLAEKGRAKKFDIEDTTTDGTKINVVTSDSVAKVGDEVQVVDDAGATTPAPDGDYVIQGGDRDGITYVVAGGKITDIMDPAASDPAIPVEGNDANVSASAKVDELTKKFNAYKTANEAEKKKLNEQLKKLSEEAGDLHTEIVSEEDKHKSLGKVKKQYSWDKELNEIKSRRSVNSK